MEIAALKTVLLVETHGSLAGAARALDVDPSSVSRTVSTVEAELGVRLFQRTTRRLTVTDEGRVYLDRLAPLLDEMEAAREAAVGQRGAPAGTLRLTASIAFATEIIVPLLPAFQTRYPRIAVDLLTSDANLDLVENSIDLAIRLAPAPTGDLISTRLMTTAYRVVASPGFAARHAMGDDPTILTRLNCLRFALPNFPDRWLFRRGEAAPLAVPVSGSFVASNALTLRKAACAGMGAALLADWMIRDALASGALVDLFPAYACTATTFDTAAWALYPTRSYLPRKVRVMIDHLRDRLVP